MWISHAKKDIQFSSNCIFSSRNKGYLLDKASSFFLFLLLCACITILVLCQLPKGWGKRCHFRKCFTRFQKAFFFFLMRKNATSNPNKKKVHCVFLMTDWFKHESCHQLHRMAGQILYIPSSVHLCNCVGERWKARVICKHKRKTIDSFWEENHNKETE